MKKSILPLFFASLIPAVATADQLTVEADLVVEGDTTLEQSLHVQGDEGVLFEGTFGQGAIPTEGAGVRMMWYPAKAAFRAGRVTGNNWNDTNIGDFSVAFGSNSRASGNYSMAMGSGTASGNHSMAMGSGVTASAPYSIALGNWTEAEGPNSLAMGVETYAGGSRSIAIGHEANTHGSHSMAVGAEVTAVGLFSMAVGAETTAWGTGSVAMGIGTNAASYASVAIGQNNIGGGHATQWNDTDPLFEIGNGKVDQYTSNALTVLKNGRTTLENKFWDDQDPTDIPTDPDASDGEALVVKGHSLFLGNALFEAGFEIADDLEVGGSLIVTQSLSIGGTPIINAQGEWVGSPTGLQGPQGDPGAQGEQGPQGPEGPAGASPFELDGNDAYYTAGNVGIGTNSPSETLEVDGTAKFTGNVEMEGEVTIVHIVAQGDILMGDFGAQ